MTARGWQQVTVAPVDGGFGVRLDAKELSTPERRPLLLPTRPLADAVAAEWRGVTGRIAPAAMPFTGLANAAIDRVEPDRARFIDELVAYADGDLLCYRAEAPPALCAAENAAWNPLIAWSQRRYAVAVTLVTGILHRPQPAATLARLREAVAAQSDFAVAALLRLVPIGGSLIGALALVERTIDVEALWDALTVDSRWQAEQWGRDEEAERATAAERDAFLVAAAFLALVQDQS